MPVRTDEPFICITCEAQVRGQPVFHVGLPFCCGGCVAGGPCICSYDPEDRPSHSVRHCLDVAERVGSGAPRIAPAPAWTSRRRPEVAATGS